MEWISALKKLPDLPGKYLATDGESVEIMEYYGTLRKHGLWSSYECKTLHVTHWMPLPKPPEKNV